MSEGTASSGEPAASRRYILRAPARRPPRRRATTIAIVIDVCCFGFFMPHLMWLLLHVPLWNVDAKHTH